MSAQRRRGTPYATYGSVAYAPEPQYDGKAVLDPGQSTVVQPVPKVSPRERVRARPQVRVREAGMVSPFAVAGFLAAGIFAVLVLLSAVQLTTLHDESVAMRGELSALQSQEARLLAQYELAYDLKIIEQTVTAGGAMQRPQSGQIFIIDTSEPDSVERYTREKVTDGVMGAVEGAGEILSNVVEYFR